MRDRSNWLSSVFRNPLSGLEPSWRQALQTPAVSALIALLLMQLVAALVLAGKALDQQASDAPLLTVEPAEVTRIEILGTEQDVVLERAADGWILPALNGFPADAEKVEQLLQRLTALGRPLPVGTSPETQDRLKVADQNAETRLVLSSDDGELTTLLLGDSPGFRRLYARLAGDSEVYDLPLASFEIASDRDDWARRDQLRLDPETIQRITTNGWALSRVETGWRLEDNRDQTPDDSGSGSGTEPEPQPALDLDAIDQLLSRLANLSYQGVRTPTSETASPAASAEPVLAIEISLTNGETHQRTVYADSDGGYLLETGAEPLRYELSEYDLDGLLGLEPEQLIAAPTDALSDTDAPRSEAATTADVEAPTGKPPVEQTTEGEPTEQGPHETDQTAAEDEAVAASSPAPSPADEAESAVTASPATEDPAATTSEPTSGPGAGPESAPASTQKPESEPAAAKADGATPTKEVERQPSAPAPARGTPPTWPYPRYAPQNRPPWPPQGPPQNAPPQQAPPGWR